MATIRKRTGRKGGKATKGWQAIVRRGDHRPQYKTFATRSEAEAWATAVENAINRDEFTSAPEAKKRTLSDLLERYRKSEVPKKRDGKNAERYLDFWIEELGHFKVSAVTRAQIVEIRDRMVETRSPATVNRYIATLRHAFRIAETDWEWATRNPCQKLALKEPRGRDRHLSDKEITRLLNAARASEHPHMYVLVLIGLTTGARRGEINGLLWGDVDLKKGRATLHATKNTDKRTLVLVPAVVEELKKLPRRIDSGRIFDSPNPEGKRTFPNFNRAWDDVRDRAKLKNFRFHDLRHTFASRMAMNGYSLPEIAGALGHRTLAMVQRYAHLTEGHVHRAMEATALGVLGEGVK